MASRFLGVPVGGKLPQNVTQASSTTSLAVELVFDDGIENIDLIQAVEAIKTYLQSKNLPT